MDSRPISTGALREAWSWVVKDVLTKRSNADENNKVHAIVCMAIGA